MNYMSRKMIKVIILNWAFLVLNIIPYLQIIIGRGKKIKDIGIKLKQKIVN